VTLHNPSVQNTNKGPNIRFVNPTKVYQRRPPHNYPIIKSLFVGRFHLSPMAQGTWVTNAFKPFDMFVIQGYPRAMLDKFDKWLPDFLVIMSSLLKSI
jgi:hypothetical protein